MSGGLRRSRDFRLLWLGETTSRLGSGVTGVALPLVAVVSLHASPFVVGLLPAAVWSPWLVVGLPAGAWIDRLPRRPVMLACDVVSGLALASVPAAAWAGVLTLAQLLATAVATGTASVFFSTAYHAYLPAIVDADDLTEANAKLQGSESAAQVAGPGLGGALAQLFGAVTGLLADAASFAVSAACLLSIRTEERRPSPPPERQSLRSQIAAGVRFVSGDRYLRALTAYGAASNLALTGYQAIQVLFLVRVAGLAPATVGLVGSVAAAGGVAGALAARRLANRFGTARGVVVCGLVANPFAVLLPLVGPGPRLAFAAGGTVVVAGVVAGNVIKSTFRQTYVPAEILGRATTSMQLVNYGTIPLGALLAGALADGAGIRPAMWVTTALVAASPLVLALGPVGRLRELPRRPAQTVASASSSLSTSAAVL